MIRVEVVARPYLLIQSQSGNVVVLTSDEAQRLIDAGPVLGATASRVQLAGGNVIQPATRGGGKAFTVRKVASSGGESSNL